MLHLVQIDMLKPGEMGRRYRVGTFPGERNRQPRAYLRDYNRAWDGCVEYDVLAASGAIAKAVAIKARKTEMQAIALAEGGKDGAE